MLARVSSCRPPIRRYTGFYARQAFALAWEGLLAPTSLAERYRLLEEHGPDAAIPQVKPMLAHSWETDKNGSRYVNSSVTFKQQFCRNPAVFGKGEIF